MATIAIIFGRDEGARDVLLKVCRMIGHDPRVFEDAKNDGPGRPFNSEIISHLFVGVDAVLVAITPDEEATLRFGLRGVTPEDWGVYVRMRPNVLLEYGMAVAKLSSKVVEVSFGYPYREIPSDWLGLNPIAWGDAPSSILQIRERLEAVGIECRVPSAEELSSVSYAAPEPSFDHAKPPYDFIQLPFRLKHVDLNPPWQDQTDAYKALGFRIDHRYVEQRTAWLAEGFQPLIYKDPDRREYVLAVSDVGSGSKKMWVGKREG